MAYSRTTCHEFSFSLSSSGFKPDVSNKVFAGGMAWDIKEEELMSIFEPFGVQKIEYALEDSNSFQRLPNQGYLYLHFKSSNSVKNFLAKCSKNESKTEYYFIVRYIRERLVMKKIEIIPWFQYDSLWIDDLGTKIEPNLTVYIGGLHGQMTAEDIAGCMKHLFGDVGFVHIMTDTDNYPTGSCGVSFATSESYLNAIAAGYVNITSMKFSKQIEVKPFIHKGDLCYHCGMTEYLCKQINNYLDTFLNEKSQHTIKKQDLCNGYYLRHGGSVSNCITSAVMQLSSNEFRKLVQTLDLYEFSSVLDDVGQGDITRDVLLVAFKKCMSTKGYTCALNGHETLLYLLSTGFHRKFSNIIDLC